ncbi:N-acetyltransferase [Mycobacterium antarcticum]|uniref:N-acetylglutamate synthase, CG3035 family n=1 Tax=unclassified Mycolicibacterium TaxID=2636767 RepID=UPI00238C5D67|nr:MULTISPECIES: GNAT family N-acetyltransferase [unclassified Mycolicibacterium]BDX34576.1 N-acetyltransferase [Mycolicibacterium sp. TUM20985]GLP77780.1 N-acetyltransferase [Mycolicibacterium sp. TUM20983]GLP81820.1 N-acetyltransferase [Mycolicibacterium sp. TUM20984]
MPALPPVGTRVSLRYRLPVGSVPPLTDVVGHLVEDGATLRVRDKAGDVVTISAADVISVRPLSAAPVRNRDIRNLEHAAALGWPGVEREWIGGWLLRFGHGSTRRANSAVPLLPTPGEHAGDIADWYAARGATPLLAVPDRLYRLPPDQPTDGENVVMATRLTAGVVPSEVTFAPQPDDEWLDVHPRRVPVDVLTAVVDGEVVFARVAGTAVGRAAVTVAPDGTRWAGLSAVHVAEEARRRGLARLVCEALLAWGIDRGATRAYVQVLADNTAAIRLYESMGFTEHHRSRYVSLG